MGKGSRVVLALAGLCGVGALGCGDDGGAGAGGAAGAAGSGGTGGAGGVAGTGGTGGAGGFMTAPHPPLVQIPNHGGPLLRAVSIVTVTWPGDDLADGLAAFDSWLVTSDFWRATTSEYGLGTGSHAARFTMPTAAPATLDDTDIARMLAAEVASGALPASTPDRLYAVYTPAGTVVTQSIPGFPMTESCTDFQAYHSATAMDQGDLVYAVTPRCDPGAMTPLDYTTWGASHEMIEAATDPSFYRGLGWVMLRDQAPSPAAVPNGGELADLCDGYPLVVEGHAVTASYSNAAAAADQRPCVPAPPGAMFGAPADPAALTVAAGASGTTMLHAYSTAPLAAPIELSVFPYSDELTVSPDHLRVSNGDQVLLTLGVAARAAHGATLIAEVYAETADYHTISFVAVEVP